MAHDTADTHDADDASETEEHHKRRLGERIHEHLLAAEVAAEEAAGYGSPTVAVEAVEAAVDPEHELGPPSHGARQSEAEPPVEETKHDTPG
jgi:hypothetical protein